MSERKRIVILTGAGISAESGISTFRDAGGLWEKYDINDVATPMAWERNPALVLEFYNARRRQIAEAQPNAAHKALAELDNYFETIILTQNIDDLHERAGSKHVWHLHGEIFKARSTQDESLVYDIRDDMHIGSTCELGTQLRPHIVWFHEPVPMMEQAVALVTDCDVFCVIGTSLEVYPVAGLLDYVPPFTPKYIVDPAKPSVASGIKNLVRITDTATKGVPLLVTQLIKNYSA